VVRGRESHERSHDGLVVVVQVGVLVEVEDAAGAGGAGAPAGLAAAEVAVIRRVHVAVAVVVAEVGFGVEGGQAVGGVEGPLQHPAGEIRGGGDVPVGVLVDHHVAVLDPLNPNPDREGRA